MPEQPVQKEKPEDLPPVGVAVVVQCEHYRCLAYRTEQGKWISCFRKEELKDVKGVCAR
jgi:hypothetical protein